MDLEKLKQLLGNDDQMVARFLDIFRTETPRILEEVRTSLEAGDMDNASNLAHGLKSQLKYLGLDALSETAYELEKLGENGGQLAETMPLLVRLEVELGPILKTL